MKNLLLIIASFAFLGACQTYSTGDARHQCCADAMANGKTCECCEGTDDMNAKSMSAGTSATHTMDPCCADAAANGKSCCAEMTSCDSAAATCPDAKANAMPAMACCAEAKAKGEVCAECAKN